jgi:hypothetical protein
MLNTSFLGVVDCYDESIMAGRHLLSPVFPGLDYAQPPVNVSSEPGSTLAARIRKLEDACDPRVYAELLRLNALDRKLVSLARVEVGRRFRSKHERQDQLDREDAEARS